MNVATLRPGLLVSLKTSVQGGVTYQRQDLEPEHTAEDGSLQARWETQKRVEDPEEFDLAVKVRSKCRSIITTVCTASEFGLLCPSDRENRLAEAIQEARMFADAHNRDAKRTQVSVYVITGRIAQDDVEATRAIISEVRGFMEQMEEGVKAVNVEQIREAASKAKQLGAMLSEDVQGRVNEAVLQAREAARLIVKRVQKAGEDAATVAQEVKVDAIQRARFSFLDLDAEKPVEALPVQVHAGLDLPPEEPKAKESPSVTITIPAPSVPRAEV